MQKSIKTKIIRSHLLITAVSCIILTFIVTTFMINRFYQSSALRMEQVRNTWLEIENLLYISITEWQNGRGITEAKEKIAIINEKLDTQLSSRQLMLYPPSIRQELAATRSLWEFSRDDLLIPTLDKLQEYIEGGKIALLLDDKTYASFERGNKWEEFYATLDVTRFIFSNAETYTRRNKPVFIALFNLIEDVKKVKISSRNYKPKIDKTIESVSRISYRSNLIAISVTSLLVLLQVVLGVAYAYINGYRFSRPIIKASRMIITFIGDSFEKTNPGDYADEIAHLTHCIHILIRYYRRLSEIAQKLSVGDTSEEIRPKSEYDVMGNAFLRIVNYLKALTEGANRFIEGNYAYKVKVSSSQDILAVTYNKLSQAIVSYIEKSKEMVRMESELSAAAKIQSSYLPGKEELLTGLEVAHICIPSTEVGGDHYDFRSTKNGNWIAIGDVAGHGLESGIIALIAQSAFHFGVEIFNSAETGRDDLHLRMYELVNRTLVYLNRYRADNFIFMTQNYLLEKNGTVYCSGSHEVGLLYKQKEQAVTELGQMAGNVAYLGIGEHINVELSHFVFTMESGDILLLYTDGIIEAKNLENNLYGLENLKKSFMKHILDGSGPEGIKKGIIEDLYAYASGPGHSADATLLGHASGPGHSADAALLGLDTSLTLRCSAMQPGHASGPGFEQIKHHGSFKDDVTLLIIRKK